MANKAPGNGKKLKTVLAVVLTIYGSNGEDDFDLGTQDVRVKAIGIDTYRTDNSGVFVSFPAIVYEYVGE